jgi:hypothetical protein
MVLLSSHRWRDCKFRFTSSESAYEGLRGFETQGQMFALDEMSSDALVGPTRGGDWDDNGVETNPRHTWAPDHVQVRNAWNALLSQVYSCSC